MWNRLKAIWVQAIKGTFQSIFLNPVISMREVIQRFTCISILTLVTISFSGLRLFSKFGTCKEHVCEIILNLSHLLDTTCDSKIFFIIFSSSLWRRTI